MYPRRPQTVHVTSMNRISIWLTILRLNFQYQIDPNLSEFIDEQIVCGFIKRKANKWPTSIRFIMIIIRIQWHYAIVIERHGHLSVVDCECDCHTCIRYVRTYNNTHTSQMRRKRRMSHWFSCVFWKHVCICIGLIIMSRFRKSIYLLIKSCGTGINAISIPRNCLNCVFF